MLISRSRSIIFHKIQDHYVEIKLSRVSNNVMMGTLMMAMDVVHYASMKGK